MAQWRTKSREVILDQRPWLTVERHVVELPDGRVIEDWPWVITPDYVNIVAVTGDGAFLCFRQTKYAVTGETLAIAGGYIDGRETPMDAARRELREETGYTSDDWIALGAYAVDGNRGAGTGHLFLARQAHYNGGMVADDLEAHELVRLTPAEARAALLAGEFKVLAWAAAVALSLHHLDKMGD